MEISTDLFLGDSKKELKKIPDNSIDLIVTSPPYADQRKSTYGGISADKYVEWFLPISEQLLRVLKPTGTFILNIKEKVVEGERSTYVMELILAMRKQGWLWTEEFIWAFLCLCNRTSKHTGRVGLSASIFFRNPQMPRQKNGFPLLSLTQTASQHKSSNQNIFL